MPEDLDRVARLLATNLYIARINAGRVAVHAGCWVQGHFSTPDIELPAMPGASDDAALQFSLAQGAAPMKASVVDGIEPSSYIEEGNFLVSQSDGLAPVCWDIVGLCGKHKFRHAKSSLAVCNHRLRVNDTTSYFCRSALDKP
jgi:hypothetical protein